MLMLSSQGSSPGQKKEQLSEVTNRLMAQMRILYMYYAVYIL